MRDPSPKTLGFVVDQFAKLKGIDRRCLQNWRQRFFQILCDKVDPVEYLIRYEGVDFASTGKVEEDLLSITAVHPMREEAVGGLLAKAGADWSVVRTLIDEGQLAETEYEGHTFYVRKLRGERSV